MGLSAAMFPVAGSAQESMLAGLGWHKNSAGTQVDGNSQLQVVGNKSSGPVVSTGGKGSALANAGMRVDLAGTAQLPAADLDVAETPVATPPAVNRTARLSEPAKTPAGEDDLDLALEPPASENGDGIAAAGAASTGAVDDLDFAPLAPSPAADGVTPEPASSESALGIELLPQEAEHAPADAGQDFVRDRVRPRGHLVDGDGAAEEGHAIADREHRCCGPVDGGEVHRYPADDRQS